MNKNTFIRYFDLYRIQLLPISNQEVIQEKFKNLKTNKEYICVNYIKQDINPLLDYKINLSEFENILGKYFTKIDYVDNKQYVIFTDNVDDIIAYRINEESTIFITSNSDNIVQDIFFKLCIESQEEGQKLVNFFNEISSKYQLLFVDWREQFCGVMKDETIGGYLEKNIEKFSEYYNESKFESKEYKNNNKQVSGLAIAILFFFSYKFFTSKSTKDTDFIFYFVFLGIFFLIFGVVAIYNYKLRIITKYKSLIIKGLFTNKEYFFSQILCYSFDGNYFVFKYQEGKQQITKKIESYFITDNPSLYDFIKSNLTAKQYYESAKKLSQIIQTTQENKKLSDKFSNRTFKILSAFGYSKIKSFSIFLFEKVVHNRQVELFKKEFENLKGYHFGLKNNQGLENFDFDINRFNYKDESRYMNYEFITKEKLTMVGYTYDYQYSIYISESGKLYCSYLNFLFLYGENYYEGIDNLFQGKIPLKTYNLFEKELNYYEYFYGTLKPAFYPRDTIDYIYKYVITEEDLDLYKKNLLPVLVDDYDREFVLYDLENKKLIYIDTKGDRDNKKMVITIDSEEKIKQYLGMNIFDYRILFPREHNDELLQELISALDLELTPEQISSISDSNPENYEYIYPEKLVESRNRLIIDKTNKDWYVLIVFCTNDKVNKIDEIINRYQDLIKGKYKIAYENYKGYFELYPRSFFYPMATLDNIDNYLFTTGETIVSEDYVQYSLNIDYKYAHEIALDIGSILGIKIDLRYMRKVYENDGILGIHCLAIFNSEELGEFVVIDCQNIDVIYGFVVRCKTVNGDKIKKRLLEWENHFRFNRNDVIECKDLRDDIEEDDSLLNKILEDYKLTEEQIYLNNPNIQFDHVDSILHKIKVFLRDKFNFKF